VPHVAPSMACPWSDGADITLRTGSPILLISSLYQASVLPSVIMRRTQMSNLLDEIKMDVNFVRSHTLQPKWYKTLKVVLLAGFLVGYGCLFGLARMAAFLVCFLFLSLVVHLVYRAKTQRFQCSWLDFVVAVENGKPAAKRIGKFYYAAIVLNTVLSVLISQVLPLA
jgi:hypothetical protein